MLRILLAISLIPFYIAASTYNITALQKKYKILREEGSQYFFQKKFEVLTYNLDELKLIFFLKKPNSKRLYRKTARQIAFLQKSFHKLRKVPLPFHIIYGSLENFKKNDFFFKSILKTKTGAGIFSSSGHTIKMSPNSMAVLVHSIFDKKNAMENIKFKINSGAFLFDVQNSERDKFTVIAGKNIISATDDAFSVRKTGDTVIVKCLSRFIIFNQHKIDKGTEVISFKKNILIDKMPEPPGFLNSKNSYKISKHTGLRLKWNTVAKAKLYHLRLFRKNAPQKPVFNYLTPFSGVEISYNFFRNNGIYFALLSSVKSNKIESISQKFGDFKIEIDTTPPVLILK